MDVNKQIDNLSQSLTQIISEANLPIGVVYYIVKDIYRDLEQAYGSYLNNLTFQEIEEQNNQQEETQEEE